MKKSNGKKVRDWEKVIAPAKWRVSFVGNEEVSSVDTLGKENSVIEGTRAQKNYKMHMFKGKPTVISTKYHHLDYLSS